MAQIIMTANVVIPNGPKFAFNQKLQVEAYDLIDVTVPQATTSDVQVELPGSTDGIDFLAIQSDWFGEELKYKLAEGGSDYPLDQPLLLVGKGAVSFFVASGATVGPTSLFFSNDASKEAKVQILIGRDATPTPAPPP
jgi:hypothetical protein